MVLNLTCNRVFINISLIRSTFAEEGFAVLIVKVSFNTSLSSQNVTYPSLSWVITDIRYALTKKIEVWDIQDRGNELESKVNKKRESAN